ncbi:MAG: lysine--tRNA ligase [Patescibacteria group bacterium]
MSNIENFREERLKKIEILKAAGMDPYPKDSFRTLENKKFLETFEEISSSGKEVTLAGRIMSIRNQGGIVFADLFDGTVRVQTILKKDDIGVSSASKKETSSGGPTDKFELFMNAVDSGDFIDVTGKTFVTKRGMKSLLGSSWRMLAKSLRPIPDEWFGLKDEDERYRRRYLDMILNPEVSERIVKRSIFWNAIRTFMLERGFIEVETPVLETMTGGAEARPFTTHHNALDIDVFLRISVGELWQKKLMVGGLPKTFEIGRIFRNEGMSYEHANDYTSFEFYEAFADSTKGVPMLIDLYRTVAQKTFGTLKFTINGFDIDLGKEWEKFDFNELMKKEYGIDPRDTDIKTVEGLLKKAGIKHETKIDLGRGVDLLWKKIRKTIAGPAILTGMPIYLEPLAKKTPTDNRVVERFQILLAGSELGKAFNELNDPIDQRERFEKQQALRDAGDEEAQMADFEYVEAMEYGMPPTFGFGVSERLFSFLAGKSIRESQIFPLMRPRE